MPVLEKLEKAFKRNHKHSDSRADVPVMISAGGGFIGPGTASARHYPRSLSATPSGQASRAVSPAPPMPLDVKIPNTPLTNLVKTPTSPETAQQSAQTVFVSKRPAPEGIFHTSGPPPMDLGTHPSEREDPFSIEKTPVPPSPQHTWVTARSPKGTYSAYMPKPGQESKTSPTPPVPARARSRAELKQALPTRSSQVTEASKVSSSAADTPVSVGQSSSHQSNQALMMLKEPEHLAANAGSPVKTVMSSSRAPAPAPQPKHSTSATGSPKAAAPFEGADDLGMLRARGRIPATHNAVGSSTNAPAPNFAIRNPRHDSRIRSNTITRAAGAAGAAVPTSPASNAEPPSPLVSQEHRGTADAGAALYGPPHALLQVMSAEPLRQPANFTVSTSPSSNVKATSPLVTQGNRSTVAGAGTALGGPPTTLQHAISAEPLRQPVDNAISRYPAGSSQVVSPLVTQRRRGTTLGAPLVVRGPPAEPPPVLPAEASRRPGEETIDPSGSASNTFAGLAETSVSTDAASTVGTSILDLSRVTSPANIEPAAAPIPIASLDLVEFQHEILPFGAIGSAEIGSIGYPELELRTSFSRDTHDPEKQTIVWVVLEVECILQPVRTHRIHARSDSDSSNPSISGDLVSNVRDTPYSLRKAMSTIVIIDNRRGVSNEALAWSVEMLKDMLQAPSHELDHVTILCTWWADNNTNGCNICDCTHPSFVTEADIAGISERSQARRHNERDVKAVYKMAVATLRRYGAAYNKNIVVISSQAEYIIEPNPEVESWAGLHIVNPFPTMFNGSEPPQTSSHWLAPSFLAREAFKRSLRHGVRLTKHYGISEVDFQISVQDGVTITKTYNEIDSRAGTAGLTTRQLIRLEIEPAAPWILKAFGNKSRPLFDVSLKWKDNENHQTDLNTSNVMRNTQFRGWENLEYRLRYKAGDEGKGRDWWMRGNLLPDGEKIFAVKAAMIMLEGLLKIASAYRRGGRRYDGDVQRARARGVEWACEQLAVDDIYLTDPAIAAAMENITELYRLKVSRVNFLEYIAQVRQVTADGLRGREKAVAALKAIFGGPGSKIKPPQHKLEAASMADEGIKLAVLLGFYAQKGQVEFPVPGPNILEEQQEPVEMGTGSRKSSAQVGPFKAPGEATRPYAGRK